MKTYKQKQKEKAFNDALEYNKDINKAMVQLKDPFKVTKSDGETIAYSNILNFDQSGIMGYLEIPCIFVNLPIYHGTSTDVLERGVGHLATSALPVGGKSTHCVLTGHTGLGSAKLFTDLTEMKKEDFFFLHVLGKTLSYKVDQISIVKPEDTKKLQIVNEKDYVTLVTCTPYGVNDHRLLVRGIRTKYMMPQRKVKLRNHDSQWMKIYKRGIVIGLIIVISMCIIMKIIYQNREQNRKKKDKEKENEGYEN